MQRRRFLKTSGIFALAAGCGLSITGCDSLTRSQLSGGPPANLPAGLDPVGWRILHLASLAPSGHNSQPWLVRVKGPGQWIIEADPARRLPAVDPENREMMLSLGAFAECLAQGAAANGLAAHLEVLAKSSTSAQVLAVNLEKSQAQRGLAERIKSRRTLRKGLLKKELAAVDADFLCKQAGHGAMYFPMSQEHGKCISEGTIRANQAQAKRTEVGKELAQWVRFGNEAARKHRDGLTVASMEISGLAGFYVRNFMSQADAAKPDFTAKGLEMATEQARQGAGWIIISSLGQTPKDLINAGRSFARLALRARERKVAVHPMTQMLEEKSGRAEIAREHKGMDIKPQFILRVGYVESYPAPVSLRRPVKWFVRSGPLQS